MTFHELKRAVEQAGYFAAFQPLEEDGTGVRLVCATSGGAWGLGGSSFWIASDNASRWIVGLWRPELFAVPKNVEITDVALHLLRAYKHSLADLDESTIELFDLTRIDDF